MASLLLLTNALEPSADVLPALALLGHSVRVAPLEPTALLDVPSGDVILVDSDTGREKTGNKIHLSSRGGHDYFIQTREQIESRFDGTNVLLVFEHRHPIARFQDLLRRAPQTFNQFARRFGGTRWT